MICKLKIIVTLSHFIVKSVNYAEKYVPYFFPTRLILVQVGSVRWHASYKVDCIYREGRLAN